MAGMEAGGHLLTIMSEVTQAVDKIVCMRRCLLDGRTRP